MIQYIRQNCISSTGTFFIFGSAASALYVTPSPYELLMFFLGASFPSGYTENPAYLLQYRRSRIIHMEQRSVFL